MSDSTGQLWVVVDGRLYAFERIIAEGRTVKKQGNPQARLRSSRDRPDGTRAGEPAQETIQIGQLPQELRDEISPKLHCYTVALMGLRAGRKSRYCGSGTLVESGGRQFILTAAHCEQALSTWTKIGLGLGEYEHSFNFPNESPAITLKGKAFGKWGPDLAFLPVPAAKVADLKARKVFCNLDRSEKPMLSKKPNAHRGLWAFVGAPALTSSLDQHHLQLSQTAFFVQIAQTHRRNGFDYLDINLPLGRKGVPSSFKGVSGGGLWQIDILKDPDGEWFSADAPRLEGVAFYETVNGRSFAVRCHGRRSIYGKGLAALRSARKESRSSKRLR